MRLSEDQWCGIDMLAHKVSVNLNVFGVLMEDIVMSNVNRTLVITKQEWVA